MEDYLNDLDNMEKRRASDERLFISNLLQTEVMQEYFGHQHATPEEGQFWAKALAPLIPEVIGGKEDNELRALLNDREKWEEAKANIREKIKERTHDLSEEEFRKAA